MSVWVLVAPIPVKTYAPGYCEGGISATGIGVRVYGLVPIFLQGEVDRSTTVTNNGYDVQVVH